MVKIRAPSSDDEEDDLDQEEEYEQKPWSQVDKSGMKTATFNAPSDPSSSDDDKNNASEDGDGFGATPGNTAMGDAQDFQNDYDFLDDEEQPEDDVEPDDDDDDLQYGDPTGKSTVSKVNAPRRMLPPRHTLGGVDTRQVNDSEEEDEEEDDDGTAERLEEEPEDDYANGDEEAMEDYSEADQQVATKGADHVAVSSGVQLPRHLGLNAMHLHLMNRVVFDETDEFPNYGPSQGPSTALTSQAAQDLYMQENHSFHVDDTSFVASTSATAAAPPMSFGRSARTPLSPFKPPRRGVQPSQTTYAEPVALDTPDETVSLCARITAEQLEQMPSLLPARLREARTLHLGMSNSFRAGWAPGGVVAVPVGNGRVELRRIPVSAVSRSACASSVQSTLRVHLKLQEQEQQRAAASQSEPPLRDIAQQCNAYSQQLEELSVQLRDETAAVEQLRYAQSVWQLVQALWSRELGPPLDPSSGATAYETNFTRKSSLSQWLDSTVKDEVTGEVRRIMQAVNELPEEALSRSALAYLTGHRVEEACSAAVECRDFRLAVLMTQACDDIAPRIDLRKQLRLWRTSGVWQEFDATHQAIYSLLSGSYVDRQLPWLRAFGLHLWYGMSENSTIEHVVQSYERSMDLEDVKTDQSSRSCPPLPPYVSKRVMAAPASPGARFDMRFELIRLFCQHDGALARSLLSTSSTSCMLDYHLSWLVYDVLEESYPPFPRIHELYMNFAMQLEALGLWEWAVYVVMSTGRFTNRLERPIEHQRAAQTREIVVKEILTRNWPQTSPSHRGLAQVKMFGFTIGHTADESSIDDEEAERNPLLPTSFVTGDKRLSTILEKEEDEARERAQFLIRSVGVPQAWIEEACAIRARYDGIPEKELLHLMACGQYQAAHEVLVSQLACAWILQPPYDRLEAILSTLEMHATSHSIKDWSTRGKVFLEHIQLVRRKTSLAEGSLSSEQIRQLGADAQALLKRASQLTDDDLSSAVEVHADGVQMEDKEQDVELQVQEQWPRASTSAPLSVGSEHKVHRLLPEQMQVLRQATLAQMVTDMTQLYSFTRKLAPRANVEEYGISTAMTQNTRVDLLHELTLDWVNSM